MPLPLKIETYNENQTSQILDQFSMPTYHWPSWMVAITKNHKNCCHGSTFRVNLQPENIVDQLGWQPFSEITNMADLKWVKSELMRVPLHKLNLTLHGSNLIQWVTKVKFFTPWYFFNFRHTSSCFLDWQINHSVTTVKVTMKQWFNIDASHPNEPTYSPPQIHEVFQKFWRKCSTASYTTS